MRKYKPGDVDRVPLTCLVSPRTLSHIKFLAEAWCVPPGEVIEQFSLAFIRRKKERDTHVK